MWRVHRGLTWAKSFVQRWGVEALGTRLCFGCGPLLSWTWLVRVPAAEPARGLCLAELGERMSWRTSPVVLAVGLIGHGSSLCVAGFTPRASRAMACRLLGAGRFGSPHGVSTDLIDARLPRMLAGLDHSPLETGEQLLAGFRRYERLREWIWLHGECQRAAGYSEFEWWGRG